MDEYEDMKLGDVELLMEKTFGAAVSMCVGFIMIYLQQWIWSVLMFGLFVVLMKQANTLREEID